MCIIIKENKNKIHVHLYYFNINKTCDNITG